MASVKVGSSYVLALHVAIWETRTLHIEVDVSEKGS